MKTAFVTGATGFVGTNLVRLLRASGWKVHALCRKRPDGRAPTIEGVEVALGDITDQRTIEAAMPNDPDAVFHVAASLSLWSRRREHQDRTNIEGTRNVVAVALAKRAKRFVHTSTVGAYGIHRERVTEETRSNARSQSINYVRSKYRAEEEVRRGMERGLAAVILNPANIIGPHDTSGWAKMFFLIHSGKMPAVPSGKGSFVHVTEVARAHLAAVDRGRVGENYLLGGTDASYLEMVQEVARLLGRPIPKRAIPAFVLRAVGFAAGIAGRFSKAPPAITPETVALVTARVTCSSAKAERELGLKPRPLADMLADCHRWLVAEGHLPTPDVVVPGHAPSRSLG